MNNVLIRNTRVEDSQQLLELSREIYPFSPPWSREQIESHVEVFPEGQFVAVNGDTHKIIGMASSLVILWDDYDSHASWRDFTSDGYFTNHDPANGRTLYAAEVMVSPSARGQGVGKLLYRSRENLLVNKELLRIRAGARLRGYSKHAAEMSPGEYVVKVVAGILGDPTLSFQLKQGFNVIGLVSNYLRHDPESLGHAAIIERLNPDVAGKEDWEKQEAFLNSLKRKWA